MKSFWRWLERDRLFAALFALILALGIVLIALIWFALPIKNNSQEVVAPGNSKGATISVTPDFNVTSNSSNTASNDFTATQAVSTTSMPTVALPNPTQLAQLPNQGENPAPPPPTEFLVATPISGVSRQPVTPNTK